MGATLPAEVAVLEAAVRRSLPLDDLLARTRQRQEMTQSYRQTRSANGQAIVSKWVEEVC